MGNLYDNLRKTLLSNVNLATTEISRNSITDTTDNDEFKKIFNSFITEYSGCISKMDNIYTMRNKLYQTLLTTSIIYYYASSANEEFIKASNYAKVADKYISPNSRTSVIPKLLRTLNDSLKLFNSNQDNNIGLTALESLRKCGIEAKLIFNEIINVLNMNKRIEFKFGFTPDTLGTPVSFSKLSSLADKDRITHDSKKYRFDNSLKNTGSYYYYGDFSKGLNLIFKPGEDLTIGSVDVEIINDIILEDGSESKPYSINNSGDFSKIVLYGSESGENQKYFVLTNDITVWSGENSYIEKFSGILYGNGHSITTNYLCLGVIDGAKIYDTKIVFSANEKGAAYLGDYRDSDDGFLSIISSTLKNVIIKYRSLHINGLPRKYYKVVVDESTGSETTVEDTSDQSEYIEIDSATEFNNVRIVADVDISVEETNTDGSTKVTERYFYKGTKYPFEVRFVYRTSNGFNPDKIFSSSKLTIYGSNSQILDSKYVDNTFINSAYITTERKNTIENAIYRKYNLSLVDNGELESVLWNVVDAESFPKSANVIEGYEEKAQSNLSLQGGLKFSIINNAEKDTGKIINFVGESTAITINNEEYIAVAEFRKGTNITDMRIYLVNSISENYSSGSLIYNNSLIDLELLSSNAIAVNNIDSVFSILYYLGHISKYDINTTDLKNSLLLNDNSLPDNISSVKTYNIEYEMSLISDFEDILNDIYNNFLKRRDDGVAYINNYISSASYFNGLREGKDSNYCQDYITEILEASGKILLYISEISSDQISEDTIIENVQLNLTDVISKSEVLLTDSVDSLTQLNKYIDVYSPFFESTKDFDLDIRKMIDIFEDCRVNTISFTGSDFKFIKFPEGYIRSYSDWKDFMSTKINDGDALLVPLYLMTELILVLNRKSEDNSELPFKAVKTMTNNILRDLSDRKSIASDSFRIKIDSIVNTTDELKESFGIEVNKNLKYEMLPYTLTNKVKKLKFFDNVNKEMLIESNSNSDEVKKLNRKISLILLEYIFSNKEEAANNIKTLVDEISVTNPTYSILYIGKIVYSILNEIRITIIKEKADIEKFNKDEIDKFEQSGNTDTTVVPQKVFSKYLADILKELTNDLTRLSNSNIVAAISKYSTCWSFFYGNSFSLLQLLNTDLYEYIKNTKVVTYKDGYYSAANTRDLVNKVRKNITDIESLLRN